MKATLTGIRPSLWARCATAAAFQGRGEIEAEQPREAREWFQRGHLFEEYVMRQVVAKHGRDNVERQVVIPIPGIGEGHADGYVKPERALIEVKSTVAAYPNSPTFEFGVAQLRRYLAYHPEAEQGWLYMIDPGTLKPADVYVVRLDDEERELIEAERLYILEAVEGGELQLNPRGTDERPCLKPTQARGRLCPFADVCFDGWEPDPLAEVTSPDALEAVGVLHGIKSEKSRLAAQVRALEESERVVQAELAELLDEGESLVGGFVVRRTHVVRQPTFQPRAAEAAGFPLEALAEFMKPGSEYDLWKVSLAGDPGDVDYGEAPF